MSSNISFAERGQAPINEYILTIAPTNFHYLHYMYMYNHVHDILCYNIEYSFFIEAGSSTLINNLILFRWEILGLVASASAVPQYANEPARPS